MAGPGRGPSGGRGAPARGGGPRERGRDAPRHAGSDPAGERAARRPADGARPSRGALVEYQRSLAAFPQRFNSHDGAARAAERAGKHDVARLHYEQIVAMAGDGDGLRDELERARAFLDAR
jgi:hypothetical protein